LWTVILTVVGLGLAIAVCSPVSVVTVTILLTMPSGRRRAVAFVVGWLLAIAVIAAVVTVVLQGEDFSSHTTTPSRLASAAEILVGCVVVGFAARALVRRRRTGPASAEMPKWLDRLDETNWLLALLVGAFMLTYSLTVAAALEVLKANVSAAEAVLAFAVFAVASIVTIAAPASRSASRSWRCTRHRSGTTTSSRRSLYSRGGV
jgi:hypothetical protein